jgi:predicted DNA-binding protein
MNEKMKPQKEHSIRAYELLYDLEHTLKKIINLTLPLQIKQDPTYSNLVNIIILNNLIPLDQDQLHHFTHTKVTRNKVCHMRPILIEDIDNLRKVYSLAENVLMRLEQKDEMRKASRKQVYRKRVDNGRRFGS